MNYRAAETPAEVAFTAAVNARSASGYGLAVPSHLDVERIWRAIEPYLAALPATPAPEWWRARGEDPPVSPEEAASRLRFAALPATPAGPLDGQSVHAAWRDGMLAQGREVSPERMTWETLTDEDRALDDGIAARLTPAGPLDVEALLPSDDEPYRDRPNDDLTVGEINVRAGWRMARDSVAARLTATEPRETAGPLDVEEYGAWPDCLNCRERHVREGHARLTATKRKRIDWSNVVVDEGDESP